MPDRPDLTLARELYRRQAERYDATTRFITPVRRRGMRALDVRTGDVVADIGCGTGINLPQLAGAVGPTGQVIGVEPSPEMAAIARSRISVEALGNVVLVEADAAAAELPAVARRVFLSYTHDVLQSEAAIDNILAQLEPGGSVVACGAMRAPRWAVPANLVLARVVTRYVTTTEGLDRPWHRLDERLSGVVVERMLFGTAYLMSGVLAHE